jgi:hypothetical protein
MKPVYPLSLSSLLIVMQATTGTHTFHASIPAGHLRTEACLAQVQITDGTVTTCQITSPAGLTFLKQQEALMTLERMGELDWEAIHPSREVAVDEPLPHTSVRLIQGVIPASLPRKERQALALMDGQRTHKQIARLLHLSAEEMHDILSHLQHHNLIH